MSELILPLPPQEIRFMAESDQEFMEVGVEKLDLLRAHGFSEESSLFDVGCGYGRLPHAMIRTMSYRADYLGMDILPRHIRWCPENLSVKFSNYRFEVMDILNDRYNPTGLFDPREITFPVANNHFDFCCLFSVFTHMYEPEIKHYLSEIWRVLKPGGCCLATFFLYDPLRLPLVQAHHNKLCMTHQLNDHTLFHNPADPLNAIGYERQHVRNMISGAQFEIEDLVYGTWAGDGKGTFQDYLFFRK
jgi:SAM-dependent methyltransferase